MIIRAFDESADYDQLRQMTIELQDTERQLDPRMPSGESIAHVYLENMFSECEQYSGAIFVAEYQAGLCGYITVLARHQSTDIDDGPREYAYITDLYVSSTFRKMGIGQKLLSHAQEFARSHDAEYLMLGLLAANRPAKALYKSFGFEEFAIKLEKKL